MSDNQPKMKSAEELAIELFGFPFIDDIEPQFKQISGDGYLLERIEAIQQDAIAAERYNALTEAVKLDAPDIYLRRAILALRDNKKNKV